MKTKKVGYCFSFIFTLVLVFCLLIFVTGCTDTPQNDIETPSNQPSDQPSEHIHIYSVRYEYDENEHYKITLCSSHETLIVDKEPHAFNDWFVKIEPTDTSKGLRIRQCNVCGFEQEEEIDIVEHTHTYDLSHWDYDENYHFHMANCGHDLRITEEHQFTERIIIEPTEDREGKKEKTCLICGYITNESIEPLAHQHDYNIFYRAVDEGHIKCFNCSKCGDYYENDLEEHSFSEKVEHKNGTCLEPGYDTYICEICGYKKIEMVSGSGHSLKYVPYTASTCTERGHSEYYVCTNCNGYFYDSEALNQFYSLDEVALELDNHQFSDWTIVEEPTIYAEGKEIRTCSVCGYIESQEIIRLPHYCDYSPDYKISFEGHVYDNHCHVCGEELEQKTTPHIYENGICKECGYDVTNLKKLKLPNGTPIGDNAFKDCINLEEITFPNDITTIGVSAFEGCQNLINVMLNEENDITYYDFAFKNCTKLETIKIPSQTISNGAFYGCVNLKNLILSEKLWYVGPYAFYNCSLLCDIDGKSNKNIFETVQYVGEYAFYNCDSITTLLLKVADTINESAFENCDGLKTALIADDTYSSRWQLSSCGFYANAFKDCSNLEFIRIPYIFDGLFSNCPKLTKLEITYRNYDSLSFLKVTSVDTIILGDKVTSVNCSGYYTLKSITIGSGITKIAKSTFERCSGLTDVIWHDDITIIDNYAFGECISLKEINIPRNCSYIGEKAFYKCTALKNVNISEGCNYICAEAFEGCTALTDIDIPDNVLSIGGWAFADCTALENVRLGSGIETIEWCTFRNCQKLETLIIPDNVTTLEENALYGCDNLKTLYLSKNLISVSQQFIASTDGKLSLKNLYFHGNISDWVNVFKNNQMQYEFASVVSWWMASSLENIYFLNGDDYELVTDLSLNSSICGDAVPSYLMYGFPNLKKVTVGSGIKKIGQNSFSDCKALTNVILNNDITAIGSCAFEDCVTLESIELPNKLTVISIGLFSGCTNLKINTLPDSVKEICGQAFENCSNLTLTKLPSSLEIVYYYAFYNARLVPGMVLPSTIKEIQEKAFANTGYYPLSSTIAYEACTFILPNMQIEMQNNSFENSVLLFEGAENEFKALYPDLEIKHLYYYSKEEPTYYGDNGYWYYTNEKKPINWLNNSSFEEFVTIK